MHCLKLPVTLILTLFVSIAVQSADSGVSTQSTDQTFEEATQSLQDAIVNQGFKIDYHGHISDMLDRTADDVGATRTIYTGAEIFTFCSAVLSRKVMEQDPADIAYCPYVLFVFQEAGNQESVTIGFRQLPSGGARDEVNAVLSDIIETASDGF